MPYYGYIRNMTKRDRSRTISGLQRLRHQLDAEMPFKTHGWTLILGTWNIRNFDDNRFMNGRRTDEDLYYLAEIIARFDVLAIQEVCDDLAPLDRLMRILGPDYDYIITDVTEGPGGNRERLGFLFDKSKVWFQGIAGELVLPDKLQILDEEKKRQFSRTPFMCSFQSGWFKFMFSTVHIYFGSSSGPKYERRVKEIASVAKFLAKRAKADEKNHVLVGDFNIVRRGSRGFNALEDVGFEIYENREGSNKDQTKFYDQISFRVKENELQFADSARAKGVLQFFKSVYREADFSSYKTDLMATIKDKITKIQEEIQDNQTKLAKTGSARTKASLQKKIKKQTDAVKEWTAHLTDDAKLEKYYLSEWRTFHGSDHLPLWVELKIDFSDDYLANLATTD